MQIFARKFKSGKKMFARLLFLPNFLYLRKSVVKKLRVKNIYMILIKQIKVMMMMMMMMIIKVIIIVIIIIIIIITTIIVINE